MKKSMIWFYFTLSLFLWLPDGVADEAATLVLNHVRVRPANDVFVKGKQTGEIRFIHRKEGDFVRKGDALIDLDDRQLKFQLQRAESQLRVAEANMRRLQNGLENQLKQNELTVQQAKTSHHVAHTRFLIQKELHDKDMASRLDFLLAKSQSEAAEISLLIAEQNAELNKLNTPNDVKVAEERYAQLKVDYELALMLLQDSVIRAPFDGVVQTLRMQVGDLMSAGTPMVRVMDTNKLILEADIPIREIQKYHSRKREWARVTFEGHGNLVKFAKVISVTPAVDESSGTIGIRLEVDNSLREVVPGVLATVTLTSEKEMMSFKDK